MEGTVFTFWYSTTRFTNSPLLSLLVTVDGASHFLEAYFMTPV